MSSYRRLRRKKIYGFLPNIIFSSNEEFHQSGISPLKRIFEITPAITLGGDNESERQLHGDKSRSKKTCCLILLNFSLCIIVSLQLALCRLSPFRVGVLGANLNPSLPQLIVFGATSWSLLTEQRPCQRCYTVRPNPQIFSDRCVTSTPVFSNPRT